MKITIENAGDMSPQNLLKLADKLREIAVEIAVPEPKGIDWEAFAEKIRLSTEERLFKAKPEPPATYEEVEYLACRDRRCIFVGDSGDLYSNKSYDLYQHAFPRLSNNRIKRNYFRL